MAILPLSTDSRRKWHCCAVLAHWCRCLLYCIRGFAQTNVGACRAECWLPLLPPLYIYSSLRYSCLSIHLKQIITDLNTRTQPWLAAVNSIAFGLVVNFTVMSAASCPGSQPPPCEMRLMESVPGCATWLEGCHSKRIAYCDWLWRFAAMTGSNLVPVL